MPLRGPERQLLDGIRTDLDRVWSTWESLGGLRVPDTMKRDVADRYLRQNIQQYDLRSQTHRAALVRTFEGVVEREVAKAALILRENRPTPRAHRPFAHSASLRENLELAWFVAERVVPFKRLLAGELRPGYAERLRGIRNPWGILAEAWNRTADDPSHRILSRSSQRSNSTASDT